MSDGWGRYSNVAPILFPRRVTNVWCGNHYPDDYLDPKDPDDFDLENPETDYEHALAAITSAGFPHVLPFPVGDAPSLLFFTETGNIKWWPEEMILVSGWELPDPNRLTRVNWKHQLEWRASEREYLLMCSWDHPASPDKDLIFPVEFETTTYAIHWGRYGWDDDSTSELFRFVKKGNV